jgi:hypothetical protein
VSLWAVLAVTWAVGVAGASDAQIAARPRFVEDEIAGIRLGLDRSDEIVQLYGHGFKASAFNATEQFCYWDESRQLGVQFRLDARGVVHGVNVAEVPEQIDKACRDANLRITKPITTGKRIALGDSLETVLAVDGEPGNRVDGVARGRRFIALEYEAQLAADPAAKNARAAAGAGLS